MSQLATLQLKNQAGTEVNFVVNGVNYTNNVATWSSGGSTFEEKRFATFSLVPPTGKATRARLRLKVTIPILDSLGAGTKVDEAIANVEFVLPKLSTLEIRQDLRAFMADFLTDAVVVAAIENYEGVY